MHQKRRILFPIAVSQNQTKYHIIMLLQAAVLSRLNVVKYIAMV
nr:MAG TPA_asm: hypothetical protein [Bacteriophage sp.]